MSYKKSRAGIDSRDASRRREGRIFDELGEYREPVYLTSQLAYGITLRLAGTAADRHTVMVYESRYDRAGRMMVLNKVTIVHVRQLPAGGLLALSELIDDMMKLAKEKTPGMEVEFHVDTTRSPVGYHGLPHEPQLYMLTTTGLDRYGAPYRWLGRLLLLSSMQIALKGKKLVIALPDDTVDPIIVTANRLEQALSNMELKTPKAEGEELLLDMTGPDDDLALCVGLSLFLAEERLVSPEDQRFVKAAQLNRNKWVV